MRKLRSLSSWFYVGHRGLEGVAAGVHGAEHDLVLDSATSSS
jgi:hypothetical protein